MRTIVSWIVALSVLSLCSAALGQDQPAAGQTRADRAKERLQNLTPEQRAKLKDQRANMSEEERAQVRAKMREQAAGDRPGPEAARDSVAEQIAALKKEHQVTVGELQSIKVIAVKEKATETAKALDALIARHHDAYQKRLKQMEQRLQRAEDAKKDAPKKAPEAGSETKKAPAQKPAKDAGKQGKK